MIYFNVVQPDPFDPIRLEFHTGKLFIGQDIRGKDEEGIEKTDLR
jgi:hypothetical protein